MTQEGQLADSTLDELSAQPGDRWRHRLSQVALVLLALVVGLGASSWLGVRDATASTTTAGWTMTLDYPRVARAGLDVSWQLQVQHDGGFGKTLTLAFSADQFDIYEHQAFYPEPDSETRDGNRLVFTFTPPAGDIFVLAMDAYVQPSSQIGKDATIAVVDSGEPIAALAYSTWLVP